MCANILEEVRQETSIEETAIEITRAVADVILSIEEIQGQQFNSNLIIGKI